MAKDCHIVPPIKNSEGNYIESHLFKELREKNKERGTEYSVREYAKKIYHGTHTDHFMNWFGDWINDPDKASLVVDENGEPRIVDIIIPKTDIPVPGFIRITDDTIFAEFEKNGGKIINKEDLAEDGFMYLTSVHIDSQEGIHDDPIIQAAIKKWKVANITDESNPYVWAKEDKLGLIDTVNGSEWHTVNGKRQRRKKLLTWKRALKLAEQARDDGFGATVLAVSLKGKLNRYVVKLSKDISQLGSAQARITEKNTVFELAEEAALKGGYFETSLEFELIQDRAGISNLTDVEKIHEKAKEAMDRRLAIMLQRYSFIKREDFEDFYNEFTEANNTTEALTAMVVYSAKKTAMLWKRYEQMQKDNVPFTPEVLTTWTDFLIAYETLDEIQQLMLKDPSVINDPKVKELLNDTVTKKNFLKNLYNTEGVKLMAKWLAPFFNGIYAKFKDDARKEYRMQYRKEKRKTVLKSTVVAKLGTEEDYVEKQVEDNKADLAEKTENLLLTELQLASRDIGELSRWIDNMLDTSDPAAAAAVNAFTNAEEEARVQALTKQTEIVRKLIEFEKATGKTAATTELKLYEQFLEFDLNGTPMQSLNKPWTSALIEEERRQHDRIFKKGELTEDDPFANDNLLDFQQGRINRETYVKRASDMAQQKMRAWRKDNLRVYEDEKRTAFIEYINGLTVSIDPVTEKPYITEADFNRLKYNAELSSDSTSSYKRLAERDEITEEAAELAYTWEYNNRWKFSNVKDKWKSPGWAKFMRKVDIKVDMPYYRQERELRASDNPYAKFYVFLTDLAQEADSKVPYAYRLGFRLPGVPKITTERIKEGQRAAVATREIIKADFIVRMEDTERGEEILTDELGNPKMFLPIHYMNQLEPENQSYSLADIYYKFWESANSYNVKRQILPELEMAKHFIDTRRAVKRNSFGDIIRSKIRGRGNVDDEQADRPSVEENTQLAKQFTDWFEMAVYGKKSLPGSLFKVSDDVVIDGAKLVDGLNRYTSLSLLALNMVQGVANVAIGEVMQAIDAFAGEHVTAKSLTKATGLYTKWLPKMMGDVGMRVPNHVSSLIIRWADILHDDVSDVAFSKKSKIGQMLDSSTAFFVQKAGEHWMQSRFLFALMLEKKAYNKQGEEIGNILENYKAVDGELVMNPEVDLEKSKWTLADQVQFKKRAKGLLSRMHGEYSDLGRVALQRLAVGRMAYMFRKFVVPGFKRRYGRRQYIQRLDQFTEGNYVTTVNFLNNLRKDMKILKLAMMSDEWAALSDHEKANIKRTLGEVTALLSMIIIGNFAFAKMGEDDDEWYWGMLAYQALRLKTELLFFSPKIDEAMTILRSPMASMSVMENSIRLLDQMFSPLEMYERGPWKGQPKIKKTLINFVPMYKQYYKIRDVDELTVWFK